jgi:putative acetyltransferase
MHVRDAEDDDRSAVLRAHREAVRDLDPGPYTRRQLDAWDHERDPGDYPLEEPETAVVVAERNGGVAGYGQLAARTGEVQAVYVHPDHGGEGVGSTLLAHLEGRAAGRGHRSVRLLASKNAVGFYEGVGYRTEDRETVEQPNGVEMECVWMRKDLHPGEHPDPARAWGRLPA